MLTAGLVKTSQTFSGALLILFKENLLYLDYENDRNVII